MARPGHLPAPRPAGPRAELVPAPQDTAEAAPGAGSRTRQHGPRGAAGAGRGRLVAPGPAAPGHAVRPGTRCGSCGGGRRAKRPLPRRPGDSGQLPSRPLRAPPAGPDPAAFPAPSPLLSPLFPPRTNLGFCRDPPRFPVLSSPLTLQQGNTQARSPLPKCSQPQNFLSNRVPPSPSRGGRLPPPSLLPRSVPARGPSNCQAGALGRRTLTPKQSGDPAAQEDPEANAQKQPPQAPRQTGSHRGARSA